MNIPPGMDPSTIPLAPNPNGSLPNFDNGPNLIQAVQGVGISLAIITFVFLSMRLRTYLKLNRRLFLDDVFLILSFILGLLYTGLVCTLGRLTKHSWDTRLSAVDADYLKKLLASSIIYGPMFFFAKAAILLLYYRAFKPKMWMRWSVYILMGLMFGAYFMPVPLNILWCMPHHGRPWDLRVLDTCHNLEIPGLVHGAMNVAADAIMVVLPLPIIIKLHAPLSKKIAISAIFSTGLLALVCSVLALYYRIQIRNNVDPVWANAQAWITIQCEIYAAICVACMPSLAKFWTLNMKDSWLYNSLHSLVSSATKGSRYASSNRKESMSNESVTALRTTAAGYRKGGHSFNSVLAEGDDVQPRNNGVYKMVTVNVSSQQAVSNV